MSSSSPALFLFLLSFLRPFTSPTNIAAFTSASCADSYHNLAGPNGYPNGTCTEFQSIGNYKSFQVVDMDPGCTVTIYGQSPPDDPCTPSAGLQFADLGVCYNSSWEYYSIDECTPPQLLPSTSSSIILPSATSTSSSTTGQQGDQHLQPGAVAGIAIGVFAALAIVVGGSIYLIWRRRQRQSTAYDNPGWNHPPQQQTIPSAGGFSEQDLNALHEKGSGQAPQELFAMPEMHSELAHELPGASNDVEHRSIWAMR